MKLVHPKTGGEMIAKTSASADAWKLKGWVEAGADNSGEASGSPDGAGDKPPKAGSKKGS